MSRLLFRILAGVFLTMLAAAMLRIVLFAQLYGVFFTDPTWYPIHTSVAQIQDILEHTPPGDIEAETAALSGMLHRRIDLVAPQDVPPRILSDNAATGPVFDGDANRFYAPIHQRSRYIVTDPSYHSFRPTLPPSDFFVAFVWIAVVAGTIGFILAFPLNRRLKRLEQTVERLRSGDLSARAETTPPDLIGNIGSCFNQMADRIQSMITHQRDLLAAAVTRFAGATSRLADAVGQMDRVRDDAAIQRSCRGMDMVIDDLDNFVRELLKQERAVITEMGRQDGGVSQAEDGLERSPALQRGIRKFFLRTCLGILIALSFTHFYGLLMSQIGYRTFSFDPTWYPLRTTALMVQRAMGGVPEAAFGRRLGSLRTLLDRRIDHASALPPGIVPAAAGSSIHYGELGGRQVFFIPLQEGSGLVMDIDIRKYRRKPSLRFHLSVLPAQFLFTILGSLLLSLPIIAGLRRLDEGMRRIRKGDLSARVAVPLNRKAGRLSSGLNEMAERIQIHLQQRRHLFQAVSHEIRTPISRIRFHLEMLTPAEMDRYLADIRAELEELRQLTEELRAYTSLDSSGETLEKMPVPLHHTLCEIVSYLQRAHPHLAMALRNEETAATVTVHPLHFRRVIQNILANAIRYARHEVAIRYHLEAEGIVIDIGDDGPGIPEDARKSVFDPFIRLESSRNRDTGGLGLGLAIVQRTMALHGGYVKVGANIPQGTVVSTFWPQG